MTGKNILEFRYINGPDPYNKIWFKYAKYDRGGNFAPPLPYSLGLKGYNILMLSLIDVFTDQ